MASPYLQHNGTFQLIYSVDDLADFKIVHQRILLNGLYKLRLKGYVLSAEAETSAVNYPQLLPTSITYTGTTGGSNIIGTASTSYTVNSGNPIAVGMVLQGTTTTVTSVVGDDVTFSASVTWTNSQNYTLIQFYYPPANDIFENLDNYQKNPILRLTSPQIVNKITENDGFLIPLNTNPVVNVLPITELPITISSTTTITQFISHKPMCVIGDVLAHYISVNLNSNIISFQVGLSDDDGQTFNRPINSYLLNGTIIFTFEYESLKAV
jgi:hypothetical protein